MSSVLGIDPSELSANITPQKTGLHSDVSKTLSKVHHHSKLSHASSLSSTFHNSLEGYNTPPQTQVSNSHKHVLRNMHSNLSFEIDIPTSFISNPRLCGRRSSKSLEFSSLQFAEEARQETIPESVMEQFDCPTPCKAYSAIANGDIENNGSSVASSVLVANKNPTCYKAIHRNKRRWPSIKTKFGKFGSMGKSDHFQHSVPLIHKSGNGEDSYPGLEKTAQSLSNIDSKSDPDVIKKIHDIDSQINENNEESDNDNEEDLEDQLNCDLGSKSRASSYLKEQFFSFFQPSDNKLALKLFGNKNAVNKERRRQRQQGKLVIHPCSNFRYYTFHVVMKLLNNKK